MAKDIADIEFERRGRNMVARDDPGPAAPRHAPRDVPSEEKTGAYHTAHIRSARKRTRAHTIAHAHERTRAHTNALHASARKRTLLDGEFAGKHAPGRTAR